MGRILGGTPCMLIEPKGVILINGSVRPVMMSSSRMRCTPRCIKETGDGHRNTAGAPADGMRNGDLKDSWESMGWGLKAEGWRA